MKENYCIICGRKIGGKSSTKYCKKHLNQIQKYGKVLDNNPRNKFDPNEFRFIGNDIVEFDTYDVIGNVVATYKIDAEDYPLVSKYKWRTIKGYASHGSSINYLHRLVTHAKDGQQVDHINLDITDNRKCNLRFADNSLNQNNKKGYKWCSCDYSAIESRLGADIYKEQSMIDEFIHGSGDMHSLCAYMIYTKEIPRDTPIKDIKKLYPHLRKDVKPIELDCEDSL